MKKILQTFFRWDGAFQKLFDTDQRLLYSNSLKK